MLTSKYSKRLVSLLLSVISVLFLFSSCSGAGDSGEYAEYNYFIMDTYVTIKALRGKRTERLSAKIIFDSAACHNARRYSST